MIRSLNRRARLNRRPLTVVAAAIFTICWATSASAQLDPLLFVKRVPPTVIIVFDTSVRMLEDGAGNYHDPNTYSVAADPVVSLALGLNALGSTNYRRKFKALDFENVQDSATKFEALDLVPVPSNTAEYATFYNNTRLEIAKSGIDLAVSANAGSLFRWGLIKLRQTSAAWRASNNCDKPVRVTGNAALTGVSDSNPCNVGGLLGRFGVYMPSIGSPNFQNETQYGGGARVVTPAANTAASVLTVVRRPINDAAGLIPAGAGSRGYEDRPISHALDDARDAGMAAMVADSAAFRACRNTVIVLITSGRDDGDAGYRASHNPESIATALKTVTAGGVTKRFPVHVVAIRPNAGDVSQLQNIASNSGGSYLNATSANQVAQAINYAVQHGFSRSTDFDAGTSSEYLPVSPVIGTVNLKNGRSKTGAALPNTDINANPGGQHLAQRSNMMLTSGFVLPSFDGVLRAFRVFRPEPDTTKPTGWKFTKDGTPLWPDLDGRPWLAGKARTPSDPTTRNIYTYIPSGSGSGTVVPFTLANEALLRPHMNDGLSSVADLISLVRSQPIGAVIGSTPAIMDAPSLDPPPDTDYGYSDSVSGFAKTYADRRSMIFFGGNDGMIHALDARTGYEVWAFIPYNLLPKLRALKDGQPIDQYRLLRGQLAEDRGVEDQRIVAQHALHRGGARWNVLPGVRRDRIRDGPRSGGRRSRKRRDDDREVRHAERVHRLQVGVPRLRELRSDLHRDVRCQRWHTRGAGADVRRPEARRDFSGEDRRLHLVRPGRRSPQPGSLDQRSHRRLGLLSRHRVGASLARCHRAEGGERPIPNQPGYRAAPGERDQLHGALGWLGKRRRLRVDR